MPESGHAHATLANGDLLGRARMALQAFERLVDQAQDLEHEELAQATRRLVGLRNGLIAERREHGPAFDRQPDLDRINALLSLAASAEFPLVGVRWKRLCSLRDALKELVGKWEGRPPRHDAERRGLRP